MPAKILAIKNLNRLKQNVSDFFKNKKEWPTIIQKFLVPSLVFQQPTLQLKITEFQGQGEKTGLARKLASSLACGRLLLTNAKRSLSAASLSFNHRRYAEAFARPI